MGNFDIVNYFVILYIGSHSLQIHRPIVLRKVTHCGNWSILNKTGKAGLERPFVLQVGGMDLQ